MQLPLVTHKAGAIGRETASRVCGTVLSGCGTLFAVIACALLNRLDCESVMSKGSV